MNNTFFYKVGNKEDITDIAEMFGIDASELIARNGVSEVSAGDRLIVEKPRFIHVVKIGDSLSSIALKYGVKVEDIVRKNKIDNIYTGQKLVIS